MGHPGRNKIKVVVVVVITKVTQIFEINLRKYSYLVIPCNCLVKIIKKNSRFSDIIRHYLHLRRKTDFVISSIFITGKNKQCVLLKE